MRVPRPNGKPFYADTIVAEAADVHFPDLRVQSEISVFFFPFLFFRVRIYSGSRFCLTIYVQRRGNRTAVRRFLHNNEGRRRPPAIRCENTTLVVTFVEFVYRKLFEKFYWDMCHILLIGVMFSIRSTNFYTITECVGGF